MLLKPTMYAGGISEKAREIQRKRSLLQSQRNSWDCATAVSFLVGPHARWMVGVIIPIDAWKTAVVGRGMSKSASVDRWIVFEFPFF